MDWTAHLKHLQIVFQELDADAIILKSVLISLFCNSLQPSIRAQAKQDDCRKDTWKQFIKKTITVEAKYAFNLLFSVQEIDTYCPWGHQSSPKADKCTKKKVFNRNFFRSQKSRPQPPQYYENTKTLDMPQKNHRNIKNDKRGHGDCGPCGPRLSGFILATGVNINNFFAWNQKPQ